MRYPCNYVCFPCRKSARVGMVSVGVSGRIGGSRGYPGTPSCPGCANIMLAWRDEVPKREKDWAGLERRMARTHLRDVELADPFHPNHWELKYSSRYGTPAYTGWMGNPCAPVFFHTP